MKVHPFKRCETAKLKTEEAVDSVLAGNEKTRKT